MNKHPKRSAFLRPYTILWLVMLVCIAPAYAGQAKIAVAANFRGPMEALLSRYHRESSHRVVPVYGASGALFAQIRHGAPFDVFMSADQHKPKSLVALGLGVEGEQRTYASGRLALWRARKKQSDPQLLYRELVDGEVVKLAIANPKLAPYGVAASEVLVSLGLEERYRDRLVYGASVSQAFQFVETGNADLGLVALSQVHMVADFHKYYWPVPSNLHAPIRQDLVLLKRAVQNEAAKDFMQFIERSDIKALITSYGYEAGADQ